MDFDISKKYENLGNVIFSCKNKFLQKKPWISIGFPPEIFVFPSKKLRNLGFHEVKT